MLILAADHLIQDLAAFGLVVSNAIALARQDKLVTFCIVPVGPEIGIGYIETGEVLGGGRLVVRFVEKPSFEKACEYVAAGNFLWNSGMFCFKAGVILEEMAIHAPDLAKSAAACWEQMRRVHAVNASMLEIPSQASSPQRALDSGLRHGQSH